MTPAQMQDMITDLQEIRAEITRVNQAAGVTIFNPAATEALEESINTLKEELR